MKALSPQAHVGVDGSGADAPDPATARRRRAVQLTSRDRELLAFVAEHRLVLADHVQALLGVSAAGARARLRALSQTGFTSQRQLFHRQPACHQITRKGLAVIGSHLPPPRVDLRCYQHDLGVAWLWLAARSGTFGPMREVVAERQLRSRDASAGDREPPLAVRLGGLGPGGRERLHYPDLLLLSREGRRIAIELELSSKGRARREKILAGYGADARVDAVLYLVDDRAIGRAVSASARRLGLSPLVHVQEVRRGASMPSTGAASAAQRVRRARRSQAAASSPDRQAHPRTTESER